MTTRRPELEKVAACLQKKIAANPDDPAAQAAKADLEALEAAKRLGEDLNKRRKTPIARPGNKQEARSAVRATGTKQQEARKPTGLTGKQQNYELKHE